MHTCHGIIACCMDDKVSQMYSRISPLPEMLCELYNLQYLNVSGCIHLRELPQGIGKLVNLRHLLNSGTVSLTCMPIGIARLTNLRRLTKFIVGIGNCRTLQRGGGRGLA